MFKCSVDYDDTLSKKEVQLYIKSLIDKDVEVWIVTSRYDAVEKYPTSPKKWMNDQLSKAWNELFEVADKLGIPRDRIVFTNKEYKYTYFDGKDFLWHLDDNPAEIKYLSTSPDCTVIGILYDPYFKWRETCDKLLENEK